MAPPAPPINPLQTMSYMETTGPATEFFDDERRGLITAILWSAREREIYLNLSAGTTPLNPGLIAAFWMCDLLQLRRLRNRFGVDAGEAVAALNRALQTTKLISRWKAGEFARITPRAIDDLCRGRDGTCVLTKSTGVTHAVRIISFGPPERRSPYTTESSLGLFWGQHDIDTIRGFLQNPEGIENYLLLSPTAHAYWNKKQFALQPLSVSLDGKSLQLKFYWLMPDKAENLMLDTSSLPEEQDGYYAPLPIFRKDLKHGYRKSARSRLPFIRLYGQSGRPIGSGHVITLTTPDPETMPLPSFTALKLQWDLHRLTALATAAGYRDDT